MIGPPPRTVKAIRMTLESEALVLRVRGPTQSFLSRQPFLILKAACDVAASTQGSIPHIKHGRVGIAAITAACSRLCCSVAPVKRFLLFVKPCW